MVVVKVTRGVVAAGHKWRNQTCVRVSMTARGEEEGEE